MDIHLNQHLNVSRWCDCDINRPMKKCKCFNEWKKKMLFMFKLDPMHKTQWRCGVHVDWTYLKECVPKMQEKSGVKQRHLYLTMIRDPVRRYVSEWKHVARGATWIGEPFICRGKSHDIPKCYKTPNWINVTLTEFMACPSNNAVNRQTKKLADLALVNCYNTSGMTYEERHLRMLESAKDNLRNMAFFGVTDYQVLTQILFEYTFNLSFTTKFSNNLKTISGQTTLGNSTRNSIMELNKYDLMLYQYGKDLFLQRLIEVAKNTKNTALREDINNRLNGISDIYE